MTLRERLATGLVLSGVLTLMVAAAAYDGWRAAVAVFGVAMLGGGVLLGLDDPIVLPDPDLELGDL